MSIPHSTEPLTYAPVPSFPGVFARTDGTVWTSWMKSGRPFASPDQWRQIKGSVTKSSKGVFYLETNLRAPGRPKAKVLLQWLVCEAFHGPRPDGLQCRHLDGDGLNNRPDNLAWGTQADNEKDKISQGRYNHGIHLGSDNVISKLSETQVLEIYERAKGGEKHRLIAAAYGVKAVTITGIARGRNWAWLTGGALPLKIRQLTQEEVDDIRERVAAGEGRTFVAKVYGVSKGCVRNIVLGKSWRRKPGG